VLAFWVGQRGKVKQSIVLPSSWGDLKEMLQNIFLYIACIESKTIQIHNNRITMDTTILHLSKQPQLLYQMLSLSCPWSLSPVKSPYGGRRTRQHKRIRKN